MSNKGKGDGSKSIHGLGLSKESFAKRTENGVMQAAKNANGAILV
jgi:hypothetical protein